MPFTKTTETESHYNHLEQMSITELLSAIHTEDKTIPFAIEKALPQIEAVTQQVVSHLKNGGRLFYIGSGTSGRLGIVDASECPPTFGVSPNLVIGIIAGGDNAIRKAVEFAEDSLSQGFKDLESHNISENDIVIGIAASGTTPYVLGAIERCNTKHITTACITCNAKSPLAKLAQFPIEVVVGPEVVTGSSRMKAGTAQKLVLNMISTVTMIQLGHVKGNKMVDMQLTNTKLVKRGITMLMNSLNISEAKAKSLLNTHNSVRLAIKAYTNDQN